MGNVFPPSSRFPCPVLPYKTLLSVCSDAVQQRFQSTSSGTTSLGCRATPTQFTRIFGQQYWFPWRSTRTYRWWRSTRTCRRSSVGIRRLPAPLLLRQAYLDLVKRIHYFWPCSSSMQFRVLQHGLSKGVRMIFWILQPCWRLAAPKIKCTKLSWHSFFSSASCKYSASHTTHLCRCQNLAWPCPGWV